MCCDGGGRCGKTEGICRHLVAKAMQFPDSRQLAARFRRKDAKATVWDQLCTHLSRYVPRHKFSLFLSDLYVLFDNGSMIVVDGLDDKERVEKIRGSEWCTMFVNEATQVSYDTITTLRDRLAQPIYHGRTGVPGQRQLILDCNPKWPQHWLHRYCIDGIDPANGEPLMKTEIYRRIHWTPFDNPYLPEDYIDTLRALPRVKRMRMLQGIWCANDGAVYDIFEEDVHVIEPFPIPKHWRRVNAVDFGYRNPYAHLWGALDEDGRLYIERTHYVTEKTVRWHCEVVKDHTPRPPEATVADWDAEDCATMHENGISTINAFKDIRPGIDAVLERLKVQGDGRPRVMIFDTPTNKPMINEMYAYMWPEGADIKNNSEVPVDKDNHCPDALRYLIAYLDIAPSGFAAASAYTEKERESNDPASAY